MNSTEPNFCRARGMARLIKWPLLCGLLALVSSRVALAADSVYVNNAVINYPLNVNIPPVIDATNFINNSQFIINFQLLVSLTQPFYETSDTLNYTNYGLMVADTGFQFDNQSSATGLRTMAGTFYNPGTVGCGSLIYDTTAFGSPYDQCFVNATNIVNPGLLDVGADGLIQLTGQHVDLTRGQLTVESSGPTIAGTGYFGLNVNTVTNGNTIYIETPGWDPSVYLGVNYAESALFPIQPIYLYLPNSTAYFQVDNVTPSNTVIRSVFIEDTSGSNVSYNVYFDTAGVGVGSGNVTIGWAGSYLDAATGLTHSNYLYLNNNYLESIATNDGTLGGIPLNFTFTESAVPQIVQAPAPAGFQNIFPSGALTNRYAFMNARLIPGTADPSSVANLAITNLPGRIQINASHELNLAMAQVSGPNYWSVQSTNHFGGSPGASIQVPYSDYNLGVTNGFLTLSNLMDPKVPVWSGTCQAWSTRWTTTSSNIVVTYTNGTTPIATNTITVTNDFRVLLVGSQFSPVALAQVQDMILHGTNTVISDAFQILRTFNSDAQNLTLTTNGASRGASSLDGEINLASPNIFWASSLPNLRNLTNNGAIRLQNLSYFNGTSNSVTTVPAAAATGTLSEVAGRANPQAGDKVVIGANAYVFVSALANGVPNQVQIAAAFDGSMNNLIAAINGGAGAGASYSTSTVASPLVAAGPLVAHAFTVTATTGGSAGNAVFVANSVSATNLVWSGVTASNTLSGGVDGATNVSTVQVPYLNLVNGGLLSDQGSQVWANNFESSGAISNGSFGSFVLQSQTAAFSNGVLYAGGDVSITTGSLVTSNVVLEADRSLTLNVTDFLTDTGVTNGSVWTVGGASVGTGLSLPIRPATAVGGAAYGNSLLGTTITLFAPTNVNVVNTWAAGILALPPPVTPTTWRLGISFWMRPARARARSSILPARAQATPFTWTGWICSIMPAIPITTPEATCGRWPLTPIW